jgi:mannose-6-phosphate isomerase-like protein (cupin superfamily)
MADDARAIPETSEALHTAIEARSRDGAPTFFKLEARLPLDGRANLPMATSANMWVVLKTYASGGENELHAHPNEDHTFVILQGAARFFGPGGEEKVIGAGEGVLLPRGTFYWFQTTSVEPMVLLRVGSSSAEGDRFERVDVYGETMQGDDPRNKKKPLILSDRWYGRD